MRRSAGDRSRVTAQLIDVAEPAHTSGRRTYDRDLSATAVFAVQSDVTEQVVARDRRAHSGAITEATQLEEVRNQPPG